MMKQCMPAYVPTQVDISISAIFIGSTEVNSHHYPINTFHMLTVDSVGSVLASDFKAAK
jgi:hypothetical protein